MIAKPGDRIKFKDCGLILECIMKNNTKFYECRGLGNGHHGWIYIGEIKKAYDDWHSIKSFTVEYLGNFSKVNSFTRLYDKLTNRG